MTPLKKGQKLTDNPKDIIVRVRMDKETLDKLDYLVSIEENANRSTVIRKGIELQFNLNKK